MASTGDLNVTIYGGDRKLWIGDEVRMLLVDPFAQTRKVLVDQFTKAGAATVLLTGIPTDRGQNYALIASAKGFRDAAIYPVKPVSGGVRHTAVMLIRKNPEADFSAFSFSQLQELSPGFFEALNKSGINENGFISLEPKRIAGTLNIEAKLRNTTLSGALCLDFLREFDGLSDFKQDRILARVEKTMSQHVRAEIEQFRSFEEVPSWANEVHHAGYPISFKQKIPFGSLQLSFAAQPSSKGLLAADIDIDLFTDIGHWGEVIRNTIAQQDTDPFTVYVQLFDQRVFPMYLLKA